MCRSQRTSGLASPATCAEHVAEKAIWRGRGVHCGCSGDCTEVVALTTRSQAACKSAVCAGIEAKSGLCALQRFAAVIMRIRDPKTTALIFKSGKMVRGVVVCSRSFVVALTQHTAVSGLCTDDMYLWFSIRKRARVGEQAQCVQVCTGAKSEEAARMAARKVRALRLPQGV